jgi:RNA polymerase sigma-70 factor (ECF subfamily)
MPARPVARHPTDEPLDTCERAVRGDQAAILALYREHHAHVWAFAGRLIGDDALAEDLVHEVFETLPKTLSRFRGEGSIRSYLLGIAARRAHHLIRAAARRRALETRLAREPTTAPAPPDAQVEREQLARLLSRALDDLPIDQRIAFVLCEVEERTSVEAAAMLGENDSTIRARVFHARKKLRESLAALTIAGSGQGGGGA